MCTYKLFFVSTLTYSIYDFTHIYICVMCICIHIGPVSPQAKSKTHYITHSNDFAPILCGTLYTEITPKWAQR